MECLVLKVLLQPIVENAIYHGIKNKLGNGTIRITGKSEDGKLLLEVSDNGVGMTREQLEGIYDFRQPSKVGGIGVRNVDERIKLYFGHGFGLDIHSEYDAGTTVRITLPMMAGGERS